MRRAKDRDEGAVMSAHQRPPTGSMLLFHAGRPNTSRRTAQPTIVEEPGPPPGRAGALVVREQQPGAFPWESQAVRTLAKKVGRRDPSATPMMVEGREGTILAAVGDQADHQVAGEVLKYHQTQRRQAQLADAAAQGVGDGIDETGVGPLERCVCVCVCLCVCASVPLCLCASVPLCFCECECVCVSLCVCAPGWRDASASRVLPERRRLAEAVGAIGS